MRHRGAPGADRLPPLLRGRRVVLVAQLAGTAVGQSAVAVLTVVTIPRLLDARSGSTRALLVTLLVAAAALLGVLRGLERVLAEHVGQDYVQELRVALLRSSLVSRRTSVGVTVARATNDLSSVRAWVAQGITPIGSGIAVTVGSLVALYTLAPALAVAILVLTACLILTVGVLSRAAYTRSRELRRRRGLLAAQVADTVHAAEAIRAAGGVQREVRNIGQTGQRVAAAAISRARVAGAIRGAAGAFASLSLVVIAAAGSWAGSPPATVGAALTVVGLMTTPVAELGRLVELRQSFRAARRVLGPALAPGRDWDRAEHGLRGGGGAPGDPHAGTRISGIRLGGRALPDLVASPGDRILVRGRDRATVRQLLLLISGAAQPDEGNRAQVDVGGISLRRLSERERRRLVGYAGHGQLIERGTIARAIRYRDPDSGPPIDDLLDAVGLGPVVSGLPFGDRTKLVRGGEPLERSDRARVLLARAVYGQPPLVVLHYLDRDLGAAGRDHLAAVIAAQPGVVVAAVDDPCVLGAAPRIWDLDEEWRHDVVGTRGA